MKLFRQVSVMKVKHLGVWRSSLNPFFRLFLASSLLLMLSACGTGSQPAALSAGDASEAKIINDAASNMEIAQALYFGERILVDFYKEDKQGDAFYTISHVKNTSLLPVVDRAGLSAFELASDDFVEALAWSDKTAEFHESNLQLTDNTETLLYYQFSRFNPDFPEVINIHRVFKASILDRSGVDRSDEDARYKGRITSPGLAVENVKMIVEYLWMFTLSNNYGNAVLDSSITETVDEYVHVMKQASLNRGINGNCDSIEIYEIRYTVPKSSGFIWKDKVLTKVFTAKNSGSFVEMCQ